MTWTELLACMVRSQIGHIEHESSHIGAEAHCPGLLGYIVHLAARFAREHRTGKYLQCHLSLTPPQATLTLGPISVPRMIE